MIDGVRAFSEIPYQRDAANGDAPLSAGLPALETNIHRIGDILWQQDNAQELRKTKY